MRQEEILKVLKTVYKTKPQINVSFSITPTAYIDVYIITITQAQMYLLRIVLFFQGRGMSVTIRALIKTVNLQSVRQSSHFAIPASSSVNNKTEKKSLESVFNTAEFSYFHVSTEGNVRNNKKENGKGNWGVISSGNFDSERPCMFLPESEFKKALKTSD